MASNKIKGYKTVNIDMCSWHDPGYKYQVGKTFEIKDPTLDGKPCGRGLHFSRKKKDVWMYTHNADEYILLAVEADKKDVLGEDSFKTRVRKLKIVKVLEEKSPYGLAFIKAVKEIDSLKLGSVYMKPVRPANAKKVLPIAKSLLKYYRCNKVRIIDNIFELRYIMDAFNDVTDRLNVYASSYELPEQINVSYFNHLKFGKGFIYTADIADSIVSSYLLSIAHKEDKLEVKRLTSLVKLLSLGALPIGPCWEKTFSVFVPSAETFEQLKLVKE